MRTRALVLLGLVACGEARPAASGDQPPRAGSLPIPTASTATAPSASAAASASAEPPVADDEVVPPDALPTFDAAIVKKLGPEGVRALEVAASVCSAVVAPTKDGKLQVGCHSCPPFRRETGPNGAVEMLPESADYYPLEAAYFGSFTKPGADEVAAVFAGCEPYAGNYGGTLLASREKTKSPVWVARSYRSGFHPDTCKPYRLVDNRSALLCKWTTGKQTSSDLLDLYDFAAGDEDEVEKGWSHVFGTYDDAWSSCINGIIPGASVVSGSLDAFRLLPQEGALDKVEVDVTFGATKPAGAFQAGCKRLIAELDKPDSKGFDLRKVIPRKKLTLTLVWDGKALVLDAASEKRWQTLQPEQPVVD